MIGGIEGDKKREKILFRATHAGFSMNLVEDRHYNSGEGLSISLDTRTGQMHHQHSL